ncbi:lipoprotein-anchoring transpeptidase ErfK/SrfK [Dietzia sp. 2505]|uniref:L,D-transpeptidase n=1 Tax=Dietzia sp. 2505 TaxID=3156457 RepID=UPI0033979054
MRRIPSRVVVGAVAALLAVGTSTSAASAQVALPPEAQQVLDQALAGSVQADADLRTAAGGWLESAGITPPPGFVPPPAAPPPPPDRTPQSPCPRTAAACVDLDGNRTWLQSGERLSYGPVRMSHGRTGWETPRGTFQVTRKVRHEVSRLFDDAPMPYSVYFVGGIAFHEGDPAYESHGCIRMDQTAAATYFERLQVGDTVVVF